MDIEISGLKMPSYWLGFCIWSNGGGKPLLCTSGSLGKHLLRDWLSDCMTSNDSLATCLCRALGVTAKGRLCGATNWITERHSIHTLEQLAQRTIKVAGASEEMRWTEESYCSHLPSCPSLQHFPVSTPGPRTLSACTFHSRTDRQMWETSFLRSEALPGHFWHGGWLWHSMSTG